MKRLFLLAMLIACSVHAADFGDIPASLALPAGTSVRRNAGNTGFEAFTPGAGSGNVSNSGTPLLDQIAVWTDATHIKGVTTIKGGTTGQVLTKSSNTDYAYVWDDAAGGSFLSANIARVDPSGNDGTGTVGDLNKPFLTVQAAINAAAALPSPIPSFVTIQVGLNHFTESTTINFRSPKIVFEGVSAGKSQPFDSLTFGTADGAATTYFYNCSVGTITQTGNTQITIGLFSSVLRGDITGDHIYVKAYSGSWADSITIFGTSDASIDVRGLGWDTLDEEIFPSIAGHRFSISTPTANGNTVTLWKSVVRDVITHELDITDSIILNDDLVTTKIITDNWFDPSRFDFSTLPTDDPDDGIHAWRSNGVIRFGSTPTATPTATATATSTPTATATATPTPTPTATATPDVSDVAYDATSWDGVTTFAPSKNAVRDIIETLLASIALKAPLASPTLTGVPLAPTASQGTSNTQIATTAYTDTAVSNAIAGVNPAVAVQAATTAAGDTSSFVYSNGVSGIGATLTGPTANVAVTIDGYTFTAVNQRLLVKNDTQSPSGAFNGVYFLSTLQIPAVKPVFTRALDYDMPSDINNTGAIPVVNGTVNGTTSWVLTSQVTTVGTDPLTFTQFSINPTTLLTTANISDTAFASSWNGVTTIAPSKNAIYDEIHLFDTADNGTIISAGTGFRIGGAAASNAVLTGNGTNFVSNGTPAIVGTNFTGTAASLTAGNVTTNANLTGVVTSSGNATSLGSFTSSNLRTALTDENGTGAALFDSSTSATFITPLLGTPTSGVMTNVTGTADGLTAGDVTRNHAVYAGASPPTVDVGMFTIAKTGVNLKAAGTTAIFTVPTSRTFVATGGFIQVTAVTTGGAGVQVSLISESGGSRTMVSQSTSNSTTPVANQTCYAIVNAVATVLSNCTAGNNVQVVISTSHAGSTAVTGTVYVTGFYVQ